MKKNIILILALFSNQIMNAQWATEISGFASNYGVNSISVVNSNTVWATAYDTLQNTPTTVNKYIRTTNGGANWTIGTVTGAGGWDFTSIHAINKDTAWVSMNDNTNGGGRIYKTLNAGATWLAQPTATFATPDGFVNFVHFFNTNNGVCVGDSNALGWEIYTTVNGGTNWTRVPLANIPANILQEGGMGDYSKATVGNNIWFGTNSGRIYYSTNMGTTWSVTTTGLQTVTGIAFKNATNGIATDGTSMISTTNSGATWTPLVYTGTVFDGGLCFVPGSANAYFSTGPYTGNLGSSYSTDGGVTWIIEDNIYHGAVSFLNSGLGWSGGINSNATTGGMFKWSGTVGIKEIFKENAFGLFPNPMNDHSTLILNNKGNYTFELFDVFGKKVNTKTTVSENRIEIYKNDISDGCYFYKVMEGDKFISSGKLIVQ